jgi:two-component system sensor histidine kinase YesM
MYEGEPYMTNHSHFNYFSKNSMKRQLITLFICAIIIPVFSISTILGFFIYRKTLSHYEDLARSQSRLVHSTIVSTSIYLHSTYETVVSSSKLQQLLCTDDSDFDSVEATAELTALFDKTLTNTAMLTALNLYIPEHLMSHVESNKYILPFTDEMTSSRWYQKAREISGNFWTSDIRTGQNDVNYWELHYCCRIPIPQKKTYGVLVMSVSNDYLRNLISNKSYQIYMNVNEEPVFISSDRGYAGQDFPLNLDQETADSRTGAFTLFEDKVIGSLSTVSLYHSSDKLHVFVADTNARNITQHLLMIFLLVILLTLLISAVIIFLYATYFSGRINTLRLAMSKVSNNDYEIVDNIRGDDELTATFHDMKLMVEKLKSAEARLYQSQIHEQMIENQQQRMELKLLAGQINPHFLYNTLEAIRMKAFVEGNRGVANAIKLLSKSMRYVLSNTRTTSTTLEKELDYINTYMAIMKLRFASCINYDLRVDKSLTPSNYRVLPLLLQPIIENAISHGLKDMEENGRIILKISPSEDHMRLRACVYDNGIGMSKEKLKDVTAHLENPSEDSEHGIGLYNTNNRIRLFYGREYGITIKSKENFGTCVTVTIPLCDTLSEEIIQ